jgi:hypothetical protein
MTPDDLVDIEAIKRCKYAYMRCLDQKLFDDIGDLFTPDAVASYGGGAYAYEGRDAIVGFLRRAMATENLLSSHRVHHPEIDLTSPTTATGTWAMEDFVILKQWNLEIRGAAFYSDAYVKGDDGRWRMSVTGYKRTFEQIGPRAPDHRLSADWYATDGRSDLEAG